VPNRKKKQKTVATASANVVSIIRAEQDCPVSDLCDQLGIAPTLFYRWQKEFFENAHAAFDNGRKSKALEDAKDVKIHKLEAKLQKKNEVMAELMEAHTELKKSLGEL
jgi:transposase